MSKDRPSKSSPIENYAMVGDCTTAALIDLQGSVDWLCWPRFDAASCFCALLGRAEHGRWLLQPVGEFQSSRVYRDATLILETTHETSQGAVRVTDYMPLGAGSHLARIVEGVRGRVEMHTELRLRFDYGSITPWIERNENGAMRAVSGPHKVLLRTSVQTRDQGDMTLADFALAAGESVAFVLSYGPSHEDDAPPIEPRAMLSRTERRWEDWARRFTGGTPWDDMLLRSLLTLKALIYWPTGGIVAAPTTSLPEWIGGPRNWDYRFCWLRDSAFTLNALMNAGFIEEARAWRDWLQRAIAGPPEQARIVYGISGERLIQETELQWLPGYEDSKPVRIGNGAAEQKQRDVIGEVLTVIYQSEQRGLSVTQAGWQAGLALIEHLERVWNEPDDGIWEVRGGPKQFVHSKIMAWAAFDYAIRGVVERKLDAPVEQWKKIRDQIHADICAKGFDSEQNSFVQHYGSKQVDASLLLIGHVGFLPYVDPRVLGTVRAIEQRLLRDGFVRRYDVGDSGGQQSDGLTGSEGAFLPCSFWYVDNLIQQGRRDDAKSMIEHLLRVANDVGLFAEEYDPQAARMLGNFPQAFTHVAVVNTLTNFSRTFGAGARTAGPTSAAMRNGEDPASLSTIGSTAMQ